MNDQELLDAIRDNRSDKAFIHLYRYFPVVKKTIFKNGGNAEDARDVYQEALIILCKKVRDKNFTLTSKLDSYIFGICNYLWKDELKKQKKQKYVDLIPEVEASLKEEFVGLIEQEQPIKLAEQAVASLGEKCKEILRLFYFDDLNMKDIAKRLGYNSEQAAKNKKYKCLEETKSRLKKLKGNII